MRSGVLNGVALAAAVLLLVVGGPWIVREIRSLPEGRSLSARSGQRIVTLEVGGMTCAGCVSAVRGRLETLGGVDAVDVRLAQKRAYVVCDPRVADTALVSAVQSAGPGFLASVVQK
jgi:copper chaperone